MVRQERGFTLVELMVVITVTMLALLITVGAGRLYMDHYVYSNVVRTFNNSIYLARIRSIQTQQACRFVVRPSTATVKWQAGTNYNVNDLVYRSGESFTCSQAHTAAATNEPIGKDAAGNWAAFWIFTIDFQYDDLLWEVQHCQGNPLVCSNASPFNAANPARIEFNTRGFTVGYIDHTFKIVARVGSGMKAGVVGTLYTISPLGIITVGPTS